MAAPRTLGIVQICIVATSQNGHVPIRYVTWGSEQAVPVETLGSLSGGVIPVFESAINNAVPVSEVEPA